MGFDVALNRDRKRLAEAKVRDMPTDHPLRQRYIDWIHELDRILESDQPEYGPKPLTEEDTVRSRRLAGVASVDGFRSDGASSGRTPIAPDRSCEPSPIRPFIRKSGHAGSGANLERDRLFRENQMLQHLLARYV